MVDKIIKLLNKEKNKIIVMHGLHNIDQVIRIITQKEKFKPSHGQLDIKLKKLASLLKEKNAKIVFAGASSTDQSLTQKSFNGAVRILNNDQVTQGVYLSFENEILPCISTNYATQQPRKFHSQNKLEFGVKQGYDPNFHNDEEDVMVYHLDRIRSQPHDLIESIKKRLAENKPLRAIKFVLYYDGKFNDNPRSKWNATKLIQKIKKKFPNLTLFFVSENGQSITEENQLLTSPGIYYTKRHEELQKEINCCNGQTCRACGLSGAGFIRATAKKYGIEIRKPLRKLG